MSRDEVIARALYDVETDFPANAETWPFDTPQVKERMLVNAAKLIAALDAAGLVIVPKEPTDAMIEIADDQFDWGPGYDNAPQGPASSAAVYRAMIKEAAK